MSGRSPTLTSRCSRHQNAAIVQGERTATPVNDLLNTALLTSNPLTNAFLTSAPLTRALLTSALLTSALLTSALLTRTAAVERSAGRDRAGQVPSLQRHLVLDGAEAGGPPAVAREGKAEPAGDARQLGHGRPHAVHPMLRVLATAPAVEAAVAAA